MNIIVEGPDNSGKSTLVDILAKAIRWDVLHSDGPLATPAMLNARVQSFLTKDRVIFDRHTVVSESVYGRMRAMVMTDPELEKQFYAMPNIFVYCCPDLSVNGHIQKKHDTPAHLRMIEEKHLAICAEYNRWAMRYAHLMYRKGDTPGRIVRFIRGEVGL